jgi:hypothetical protein
VPDEDEDDIEIALIRGPGAKKFLAEMNAGAEDDDDGDDEGGETYSEESHPGRRSGDKKKGKAGATVSSIGSKYFGKKSG